MGNIYALVSGVFLKLVGLLPVSARILNYIVQGMAVDIWVRIEQCHWVLYILETLEPICSDSLCRLQLSGSLDFFVHVLFQCATV